MPIRPLALFVLALIGQMLWAQAAAPQDLDKTTAQTAAGHTVASPAALMAALARARGGERILLAPGDYGRLALTRYLKFDVKFPAPVTLASADPANPAVLRGLALAGVENLTLEGLAFAYRAQPGDRLYTAPFAVTDCRAITIAGARFTGDRARGNGPPDDGHPIALGLSVRGSAGVIIADNRITGFGRGLAVSDSRDVAVTGNDLSGLRLDGMDFAVSSASASPATASTPSPNRPTRPTTPT